MANKKTRTIRTIKINKALLRVNAAVALIYFSWWWLPIHGGGNIWFWLLVAGEVYHVFMALTFWATIWPKKINRQVVLRNISTDFFPSVDVFITVCGEPAGVVRKTIEAAKRMEYPNFKIYILNDGRVAKKDNWREIHLLALDLGVTPITRIVAGGNKSGNVNNALKLTGGELIAEFDADHRPKKNFLKKMVPHFRDEGMGFVQSPQFYANKNANEVTNGAWEQQRFFFGPIMEGKNRDNSAFICGTNFVIRRKALIEAGGMVEDNIAEDFLTSVYIHQKGWRSHYTKEILAKGLAPEDMLSYYKQQMRWARGSLEMLFGHNPIFKRGLSGRQKMQYLSSALYYFNGVIVLVDIVMPLLFLLFGLEPVVGSSTSFAIFFLPFIFLNLYTLNLASLGKLSFRAISFSQSAWALQLTALKSIVLGQKMGFSVTPKQQQEGNFLHLAYPHLAYIVLALVGVAVGIEREGINASVATNIAWAGFNITMFLPFIGASYDFRKWWNQAGPEFSQTGEQL